MFEFKCKTCGRTLGRSVTTFTSDGFVFCSIACTGRHEKAYEDWLTKGKEAHENRYMPQQGVPVQAADTQGALQQRQLVLFA